MCDSSLSRISEEGQWIKELPFVLTPTLVTRILLSTAIFLIDSILIFSVKTDGLITRDAFIFLTAFGFDHWLTCVVKCSGVCPVEALLIKAINQDRNQFRPVGSVT